MNNRNFSIKRTIHAPSWIRESLFDHILLLVQMTQRSTNEPGEETLKGLFFDWAGERRLSVVTDRFVAQSLPA